MQENKMKVQVKNLRPNPYRNFERLPIKKEKVASLKSSIKETMFWSNLLARKCKKGGYELAYGHHRLKALKELGKKEIDITIAKLNDDDMIRIMFQENHEVYQSDPAHIRESVRVAKKRLDDVLAEYETWDGFSSSKNRGTILDIKSEPQFRKLKGSGIGRDTITKYLGGNCKTWMCGTK